MIGLRVQYKEVESKRVWFGEAQTIKTQPLKLKLKEFDLIKLGLKRTQR